MDIGIYRILHVAGLFGVVIALGGVALYAINGGTRAANVWRRPVAILHGVGLALVLISGFGMLARLGYGMPPVWAFLKIALWLLLGAALALAGRKPELAKATLFVVPLIGALATALGYYKPFEGGTP